MKKSSVVEEIVRCGHDPIHFINKYVKIRHPVRGLIPFKTFPYQNKTIEAFKKRRLNVVLKPRQTGFTEVTSAFIAWLILFHPNQQVLALATKSDTAMQIIRRVRVALKNLPSWLVIADITTDNKKSIELANGSVLKASAKSADAGRSEALSLLVVDEAAHIKGFDDVWTGIRPTISTGGRIIMLSTPLGLGNVFEKTYTGALHGENDFNPIRVDWWEHPEHISDLTIDAKGQRTSSWFREETKGMTAREIAQEYGCEFHGSGDTYFSADVIEHVMTTLIGGEQAEGVQIYRDAAPGRRYIISVDSASGTAFDRAGIEVCDVDTMEQVAECNVRAKPIEAARHALELGIRYNNALMVVENNAVGLAVLEHIKLANYPHLFYTKKGAKAGDKLGEPGPAAEGSMGPKFSHGISTQGTNRPFMLSKLEELLAKKILTVHSPRLKAEMDTFIWNEGKPQAKSGYRDDLIMAMAFLVWVRDNYYGGVYNAPDLVVALAKATRLSSTNNAQINGASKNPDHVPTRAIGAFNVATRPNTIRLPNGRNLDLMKEFGMGAFVPRRG